MKRTQYYDLDKITPFQKKMLLAKQKKISLSDFMTALSSVEHVYALAANDHFSLERARYNKIIGHYTY